MKNKMFKYMSIAGVTILFACQSNDEFLKENLNGKIFMETFYSNENDLYLANNALYGNFTNCWHGYYTTFMVALYAGDDITTPYSGNLSYMQNDIFVRQGENEDMQSGWSKAYTAINTANGIINNYHKAKGTLDTGNPKRDEELLNYYAAQAHFVRAYTYFWLVRLFNKLPYVTTARVMDRTMQLSSPEVIYGHIVEDLLFAEEWLPETWAGIDALKHTGGAFTKLAAKAVLAEVYLTMAGYPLNKGADHYRLAAEKAKELIDNQYKYGFRLLDHCADLWKPSLSVTDEMVFRLMYNKTGGNYNVCAPLFGRPAPLGGWEAYCAELNFFYSFPAGERKNATFVTEFPLETGNPMAKPPYPWPEDKPMLPWTEYMLKHPYYNKMWEAEFCEGEDRWRPLDNGSEWNSSRTQQMIRWAEILLIYAEAQSMADGAPNALAYDCINQVRNRAYAGVGSVGKELQPELSATVFRDSVFVERGWEFAGEFIYRWFDLVRLELVEEAFKEKPNKSFLPGRNKSEWKITNELIKSNYFFPIPTEDVLLNPNLKDNF